MVLPCEDNVLRNITIDRPSARVGRFEKLPVDIELAMSNVISKEVELSRRLETLKRDLSLGLDYTTMACFSTIDRLNTGSITTINLGTFMRDNGHFATETELLAIVRRLDTNGDASLTYAEVCEFLRGSPGLSPPTVPIRVPEYVPPPLSRYYPYDWPYYRYYHYPYYSRYYPYYSRYYPYYPYDRYYPYYPYSPLPSESVSVDYEVERGPTAYSPSRTVKKTTFHSPYGSRTVKEVL